MSDGTGSLTGPTRSAVLIRLIVATSRDNFRDSRGDRAIITFRCEVDIFGFFRFGFEFQDAGFDVAADALGAFSGLSP